MESLLQQRRYHELRRTLDRRLTEPLDDAAEVRRLLELRAELAWRGHGPASDAVLVASSCLATLRAGEPIPPLVAHAVRAAARAGATATAQKLLQRALRLRPQAAQLRLAHDQLRSGRHQGQTRDQWEIFGLLQQGQLAAAIRRLQPLAEGSGPRDLRRWALLQLADLRRTEGQFDLAATLHTRAAGLFPEAEDAVLLRLAAALELWAGGDHAAALEQLTQLRDNTRTEHRAPEEHHVYRVAGEVLEVVERRPPEQPRGPAWVLLEGHRQTVVDGSRCCPGRAALLLVLGLPLEQDQGGTDQGPLSTMAHLRHALQQAGMETLRLKQQPALLEQVLAGGAMLLLEEERPTESGFLLLVGYDPVARLLLLKDPTRLPPLIRTWEDQVRRSALSGNGALLVAGPEDRQARQLLEQLRPQQDSDLELVDRCNLDHGRVPAQARIASLAEEGIARAPDLPALHMRYGESLLEQIRMGGELDFGPAGPFERWLAAARCRFPDAEWPLQIYARALELQERYDEAGIAWSDAMTIDPHDERNFIGQARVLAQQGWQERADEMLRQALILRQDQPGIMARRAEMALARDSLEEARLYAEMAAEMDPQNFGALMTRASVQEREGQAAGAMELLQRVAERDPEHIPARMRLLHHRVSRGDWPEASALSDQVCALIPGHASCWETATWVAWCAGQGVRAMELCLSGLQRCGPESSLLEITAQVLSSSLSDEQAARAAEQVTELLAASPPALLEIATGLSKRSWHEEAIEVAELTRRLLPRDPNPPWRLVQILMRQRPLQTPQWERIEALLEETVAGAGGFPYPRVILGWRRLEQDPEAALELISEANVEQAPAPVWYIQARALELLGRPQDADQVWGRLPEAFPGGVLESMGLLGELGMLQICEELLARLLVEMPQHHPARVALARIRGLGGDTAGQLKLLLEVEAEDEDAVPLPPLLEAAAEAARWDVVERTAGQVLEHVLRNSRSNYDVWPARARLAGACLARGHAEPRAQLLHQAPRHPDALAALYKIERRLEHPLAAEDSERLRRAAPGVWRTLQENHR